MAMTFEYIRLDEGMGVAEFDKHFRSKEMHKAAQFKEDARIDGGTEALGGRISAYENAERDVSFGTQRRYAVLTETHTGVIHFISLFYAFLRCAAAGDPASRKVELAEALITARKLKSLADTAEAMMKNAESSGLLETLAKEAWNSAQERRSHMGAVMRPLFEAYRKDPAV